MITGFIDVKEVMSVGMMRHHSEQEVLDEVETSTSHRKTKRFDRKDENGKTYIRANFCRHFEPVSASLYIFQVCSKVYLEHPILLNDRHKLTLKEASKIRSR